MFVLTVHVDFGLRVFLCVCMFTIPQSALAHLSLVRSHFSNTVTQIVGGSSDCVCVCVCVCGWVGVCVCGWTGKWSASWEPCVHISSPPSAASAPPIRLGKCNICQQRSTNVCVFISVGPLRHWGHSELPQCTAGQEGGRDMLVSISHCSQLNYSVF